MKFAVKDQSDCVKSVADFQVERPSAVFEHPIRYGFVKSFVIVRLFFHIAFIKREGAMSQFIENITPSFLELFLITNYLLNSLVIAAACGCA
jgi:hypothetical protein